MTTPNSERVQKRRNGMRAAALGPVRSCVADTNRPGVATEAQRQAALVAAAEPTDAELSELIDAVLLET